MADRIQHRRDKKATWESVNPVLLEGEIGLVLDDPNLYKVGDGTKKWTELPYRGFNGTVAQELGTSQEAVMSQKAVTEQQIDVLLQRNNSSFLDVLSDEFETVELPEFSSWVSVPMDKKDEYDYFNTVRGLPLIFETTTDRWYSFPITDYLQKDVTYIGFMVEMRAVLGDSITPDVEFEMTAEPKYRRTTKYQSYAVGNKATAIYYAKIADFKDEAKYLLLIWHSPDTGNVKVACQLSQAKIFYFNDESELKKINLKGALDTINENLEFVNTNLRVIKDDLLVSKGTSDIMNGTEITYANVFDVDPSHMAFGSYDYVAVEVFPWEDYFIYRYKGQGNNWMWFGPYYPTGSNLLHIKFTLSIVTSPDDAKGFDVWIANSKNNVYEHAKIIKILGTDGTYDITVDTSYLIAHENYTDGFYIWFDNQSHQTLTSDPLWECKVSNFKIVEYTDSVNTKNIGGDTVKDLFESVDTQLTELKEKSSTGVTEFLTSPSGTKYLFTVTDNGELKTIPFIPTKAVFFGNSLIGGFGEFGMAASRAEKDWYYLVTNYIKTNLNSSFTSQKFGTSDFEGLTSVDETTVNNSINTNFLTHLTGDENLVVIQLGDNVNTTEKNQAFHTTCSMALKAIRKKCPNARVVWIGMWYASTERYGVIEEACKQTGCEYIFFDGLNSDSTAMNVIGGKAYHAESASYSIANVMNVVTNSDTNITVTFKVSEASYTVTIDVDSYSYVDSTVTYTGHYYVIQQSGVASHPSDEGFRRIANRVLYQLGYTSDSEYYKKS